MTSAFHAGITRQEIRRDNAALEYRRRIIRALFGLACGSGYLRGKRERLPQRLDPRVMMIDKSCFCEQSCRHADLQVYSFDQESVVGHGYWYNEYLITELGKFRKLLLYVQVGHGE